MFFRAAAGNLKFKTTFYHICNLHPGSRGAPAAETRSAEAGGTLRAELVPAEDQAEGRDQRVGDGWEGTKQVLVTAKG